MIRVQAVAPDSLGAALELIPGTELLEVNGRHLEDFLDWEFLTADEQFVLRARLPSGQEVEYDVERPEGLPMGVMLEPPRIRRCANHCDFCFVDGNPQGMRQALYIRDDDYRLSFRYGAFHTQVVLVPGINDGQQLVRTLSDLYGLGPGVLSVSVVPVALTEFSKHALVRQPTREECRAALATVDDFAARAVADRGMPWCYGADDLYLQADAPLPPAEWYGDFEQRENGVGAVRYLQTRIQAARPALASEGWRDKRIGIVTGTAMGPLLPQVAADLTAATGAHFEILTLENTLFGPSVTTAGLLPGKAVLAALQGRTDLDLVLLPAESVNDDLLFMDDLEAHDLASQLPVPVRLSYDFVDALAGDKGGNGGTGGNHAASAAPAIVL